MKSVFAVFLVLLISGPSVAQLNFSAFPHTIRTFNVRSMSLGGATVSLSGKYSDEQINPAGIGVEGILRYSLGLQSFTRPLSLSYELTQLTGEYGFGKSAVGFSFQLLSSGELLTSIESPDQYTYKFNNQEVYSTVTYSYKLKNDLRLGVSFNYFYSSASSGTSISPSRTEPGYSWSLDLGLQYQFEKQFSNFFLRPSFGIALSDFGPPVNYSYSDMTQPLPIKLQTGYNFELHFLKSQPFHFYLISKKLF